MEVVSSEITEPYLTATPPRCCSVLTTPETGPELPHGRICVVVAMSLGDNPPIRPITSTERASSQKDVEVTRTRDEEVPSLVDVPERERETLILPSV